MVKNQKTIGAAVATLFPKSNKSISEKLSTEEFTEFATEAGELQNRLDAQAQGNTQEQTDRKTAEARVTELEGQVTTLQESETKLKGDVTAAEGKVTTLEAQVKEKDAYITKLKASVNPLPEEDASNSGGGDDYLTDTDREARASYAASQAAGK